MKKITKINFLILLSGIALQFVNAGMPEIRNEESKIRTEIFSLRKNNLKPEILEAIIKKIQSACYFIEKEIDGVKGNDRMKAARALFRLETDLAFFKAIFECTVSPSVENKTILASFANSNYRYSVLLEKLQISLD